MIRLSERSRDWAVGGDPVGIGPNLSPSPRAQGSLSPSGAGFQPARRQNGCATREDQGEGAYGRAAGLPPGREEISTPSQGPVCPRKACPRESVGRAKKPGGNDEVPQKNLA